MAASGTGDPRLDPAPPAEEDVRPIVARGTTGPSGLVIGIGLAIFAVVLFLFLDSNRRAIERSPGAPAATRDTAVQRDAPPLYVPPAPQPLPAAAPAAVAPAPFVLPQPPAGPPRIVYVPQAAPAPAFVPPLPPPPAAPPAAPRGSSDPALVIDQSGPEGAASPAPPGTPETQRFLAGADGTRATASTTRAIAAQLVNRATTVPQGTLIPAVLETALDSTRPGFSRAIVSRDVRGFDGSRVLIPRGSRLVGEYAGNASAGQNRAIITWTRLVRPDGVAIAIASPAADTLGRGGVKAHVDTHFLARLGTAILQSALDVGVALAARPRGNSVVLGLPGSVQTGALIGGTNTQPQPTLTVRAGTSIAVFVARDLDFTGVGNP